MNYRKTFIHTLHFASLLLMSVVVHAQQQSLSLEEAIASALSHNRGLEISELEISRAQQRSKIARSKVLPAINLNGQYAHYFDRPVFFGLNGSADDNGELDYLRVGGENQFGAAVSLLQPLYNPALRPERQQSRLSENKSQLDKKTNESNLIAEVKLTYLGLLVLDEQLQLLHKSLARNQKVLDDARSLYIQGRALRVDTLRAYTTIKNLQPDILKLGNAIDISKQRLLTLMGADNKQEILLTDSLFIQSVGTIPTEEEIFEEAKKSRPDLQALLLNERISEKQVTLARTGKLPLINLVGQYQVLSQLNSMRVDQASWPAVSFAGVQLSVPLFNGNGNSAKIKEAKLAEQQTHLQYTDAVEQLKVEVREVISGLHEAKKRLETQSIVKETAQLSYNIIQYRYEKGMASRLELTDAELALRQAESNYLEAIYDYWSANIQLDRVLGRTSS